MPVNATVNEYKLKMQKSVGVLKEQLKSLRTGRASTALVENIKADYYGSPTPLKQMAVLAAPQPDTIVIKPFDPAGLREIEKAIKNSDLSIAPVIEGKLIRLNVPPLTAERRKQLVAQTKQIAEQAKVSVRNIRRDANKQLEKQQKDKIITEDDLEKGKKQIDDITRDNTEKIDEIVKAKTNEIMLD